MAGERLSARVVGTIVLCGIGIWYAAAGQAQFRLGGNTRWPKKSAIYVDAAGLDAVAIGCFFISLGVINLALGIRGRRRIPVFWTGAGLLIATLLYGAGQALSAVVRLFSSS